MGYREAVEGWGFENFPGKTSTEGKLGRPGAPGTTKAKEVVGKRAQSPNTGPLCSLLRRGC